MLQNLKVREGLSKLLARFQVLDCAVSQRGHRTTGMRAQRDDSEVQRFSQGRLRRMTFRHQIFSRHRHAFERHSCRTRAVKSRKVCDLDSGAVCGHQQDRGLTVKRNGHQQRIRACGMPDKNFLAIELIGTTSKRSTCSQWSLGVTLTLFLPGDRKDRLAFGMGR